MDEESKVVPAPEYTLNVLEPGSEPGAKPRILKSVKVKPDETWFRAKPNEPKPTVEEYVDCLFADWTITSDATAASDNISALTGSTNEQH